MPHPTRMTFLDAALDVLRRHPGALTAADIVSRALGSRLLRSNGKTPERTMSAVLYLALAREPHGELIRIAIPGRHRAQRNSVRWTVRRGRSR